MKTADNNLFRSRENFSRREFLRLSARAAAALPFCFGVPGCASFAPALPDRTTGLCFPCVVGDVTSQSAVVWLRAAPGSVVSLRYGTEPELRSFAETDHLRVHSDSDDTAKIMLDRLEPGTTYYYRAAVSGKEPGPIGRFLTAPSAADLATVTFCFSGDSRESYQPFNIMDAIRAERPDFFLHLGDTIYADVGLHCARLPEFWMKYRHNRQDLPTQRLFTETSTYVIWDDHEVRNDYEPGEPLMPIGRQAFIDYWPIARNPEDPNRLYRSFRWGQGVELFILDTRQYRDRKLGTILGREQKKWLFERLAASTALFKFIATSVPFYGHGRDRWDGFPAEREELLRWISGKQIKGVVFLAADVHYAGVSRIPGPLKLKEIIAGPIGAPMNVITDPYSKRFEFFSNEYFNYAKITVDPKASKPHALVELVAEDGKRLYKMEIRRAYT